MIEELVRRGALLDLMITNKEGLVGVVRVECYSNLGYSDHEMVEFRILRGESKAKSKVIVQGFRKAVFVSSGVWWQRTME